MRRRAERTRGQRKEACEVRGMLGARMCSVVFGLVSGSSRGRRSFALWLSGWAQRFKAGSEDCMDYWDVALLANARC